jgi:hypothetical protein
VGSKKKKKSALARAARKKLEQIGPARATPEEIAHAMFHAEEDGLVRRVWIDDERWVWTFNDPHGNPRALEPTPEMLAALERFEAHGHPKH